ncbi:MAG: hypothetical protein WCI67_21890, partial [Chloroflexales bacterium]
ATVVPADIAQPTAAQSKRGRGRPRREAPPPAAVTPAPEPFEQASPPSRIHVAPAAYDCDDPMLGQILRLWSSLHPHARRAVVIYASTLWAETAHEG